ncbi:MAG: NADH:ubiquinone oxidoreductase subunit J [Rhodospirillales bacterium]|nr:NADH:ubiquinone oxidoreductase subunit J [Rhodospirillales bacterium]
MIIQSLCFYLFSFVTVAAAVMVISARNPVHSVLFLILAFFNAAGLFVLLGAEFIAMILVVVYVGAVAVLFLFVVMMLDISFSELRQGFLQYLPIGAVVGIVLLAELLMIVGSWVFSPANSSFKLNPIPDLTKVTNTEAIGRILYTDYIYLFQGAGMVLLVAMVGAIVLTLRSRPGVKKQSISEQINRPTKDSIEIKEVQPGSGAQ